MAEFAFAKAAVGGSDRMQGTREEDTGGPRQRGWGEAEGWGRAEVSWAGVGRQTQEMQDPGGRPKPGIQASEGGSELQDQGGATGLGVRHKMGQDPEFTVLRALASQSKAHAHIIIFYQ